MGKWVGKRTDWAYQYIPCEGCEEGKECNLREPVKHLKVIKMVGIGQFRKILPVRLI